ncbi:N-acetyltransferase [Vibrio sp. SM6]|uniref:N-acetyltransferase n=1 Tax=Vibrio agarilyticus TaxID=2726741 RepID=A0A7X8TPD9_9VIBR|nr:N-acetyltransferase [Vibrio agarilyticus]NLS12181.1 N-acetyltransferase [Vibrio agarilyticus]
MNYSRSDNIASQELLTLFTDTFTAAANAEEGQIVGQLSVDLLETTAKDKLAVYVARDDNGELAGAIIMSELEFNLPLQAWLLSPAAVRTENQKQGIGQSLIRFALSDLSARGIEWVVTYGDPAFYGKVGFAPLSTEQLPAPHPLSMPQGWIGQSLNGQPLPTGLTKASCVSALDNPAIW